MCCVGSALAADAPLVKARLVAAQTALVPGTIANLGVVFEIDEGWHLFWDGCNDTGYPIDIRPQMPPGYAVRDLVWPVPQRTVSPGSILDHVYEGRVTIVLPVRVPSDAVPGATAAFACSLEWVACREACEVGSAVVALDLPIAASAGAAARSADAPRIDEALSQAPLAMPASGAPFRVQRSQGALVIEAANAASLAFFPRRGCEALVDPLADCAAASNRLTVRLDPAVADTATIEGVVQIVSRDRNQSTCFALNPSRPGPPSNP